MDEIRPLSRQEFQFMHRRHRHGGRLSPLGRAVAGLEIGEGIQVRCRWKHSGRSCGGSSLAYNAARRYDRRVNTRCQDGILYVLRVE